MLNLDFYMPVRTYFGENAIVKAKGELSVGKHALIVTGKRSAKLCGAYDDVVKMLDELGVAHTLFDKIGENPKLSVCFEGGKAAREAGADFIIGIGGGSPLDAAKAISAFAANETLEQDDIFDAAFADMLPIILLPTTSGTGSEANNYSVLTIDSREVKKTFKHPRSYARAAILDPKYTYTLSYDYTLSTALDAFCHCIESYLSPKSTDISMMFALYGAKKLYNGLNAMKNSPEALANADDDAVKSLRAELMAASFAGGVAINTTGTGFPHPLGYSLTLYSGIPHGKACAAFTGEYIKYNMKNETGASRLYTLARALETTPEEIAHTIPELSGVTLSLDADTRALYVDRVKGAGNYANSPYIISYEEMLDIYSRLFV
ncbi:MAG: iron-containing alcohol dehydrogenase [Clostridia bacterium]|nr:iron-containing alcohol dehydrogenase [Clostridia bacterium]